jgi:hypothetical protein
MDPPNEWRAHAQPTALSRDDTRGNDGDPVLHSRRLRFNDSSRGNGANRV